VTREDVDHFAEFTGDTFYAHTDEQAAAENPLFGGIVAHGYLVLSLAAGLFVDPAPGSGARQHRAWTGCASPSR
jgi:oxepin-CoA hydrolase/3-oxo-5,6-dehydrosuberyl-CoA semialdehyde dehydrogenase